MALLEITNIGLRLGGLSILKQVSLKVEEGSITSVIGPNGAGKTSLFNCLSGFYRPDNGRMIFTGRSIGALAPHRITQMGMARTFQNLRLFREMTALENVMAGCHCRTQAGLLAAICRPASQRREEEEVRQVSEDWLDFTGVRHARDRAVHNLAYGDQRRVEWARALATRPKLLLLDEPAAGFNTAEKEDLIALIRKARDELGVTMLLIEHDMNLVMRLSETIVVLNYGEKIAEGNAEAIANNPAVAEAYLGYER